MIRSILAVLLLGSVLPLRAERIDLAVSAFKHITFKGIRPTRYVNRDGALVAEVDKSASALLYAFKRVHKIKRIRFRWKRHGNLQVRSKRHEQSKAGDDTYFRIGLLLHGRAPSVPFFAPAWIKATRAHMLLPASRIIYLVVSSRHRKGESWRSPYDRSIRMVAINRDAGGVRYTPLVYEFEQALPVVGLWLMADGDDTGSRFTVSIEKLIID